MRRLLDSLAFRLLIALAATVAVVLSLHAAIGFQSTRKQLETSIRTQARLSSDLVRRATYDGMLLNQLDEVESVLARMAAAPEVHAIRVYDKEGRVALSADPTEIGVASELGRSPCSSCHEPGAPVEIASPESSTIRSFAAGERAVRHLSILPNDASCARSGCHVAPSEAPILGVLDVEMSLAPLDSMLRRSRRRLVVTTVVLVFVTGAISWVFVRRWVDSPAIRLVEQTRRVASGDLSRRIDVGGRHELARLAEAFNGMTEDLARARAEVDEWSRRLEEKVLAKTDEVRRAQRHVLHMEKMASLGQLAATVAHELNNPLSGILTYVRLVERRLEQLDLPPERTEDSRQHLEAVRRECVRCGEIVRNLLLFARPRGAKRAPVDLRQVLGHSLDLVRHHLAMHDVRLETDVDLEDPVLQADAGQLEQALVALFVNAVEAMSGKGGGGVLGVRMSAPRGSARVVVEVGDTGVGIPRHLVPDIFQPFFSTKDEPSGVGLGLAVVYGIVRRHGGEITVDSEPGKGTTFRLEIPRAHDPENDSPESSRHGEDGGEGP